MNMHTEQQHMQDDATQEAEPVFTGRRYSERKDKEGIDGGTYSGPLPGLVGHTEGLMALHTWRERILM